MQVTVLSATTFSASMRASIFSRGFFKTAVSCNKVPMTANCRGVSGTNCLIQNAYPSLYPPSVAQPLDGRWPCTNPAYHFADHRASKSIPSERLSRTQMPSAYSFRPRRRRKCLQRFATSYTENVRGKRELRRRLPRFQNCYQFRRMVGEMDGLMDRWMSGWMDDLMQPQGGIAESPTNPADQPTRTLPIDEALSFQIRGWAP